MDQAFYQDELRYLRDVGPTFAKYNPDLARYLQDKGSDPDVERLIEATAFLCGRIRQKIEDEIPEFTASLMSLLWPHYLRTIPSMSVVQFTPDLSNQLDSFVISREKNGRPVELASLPVSRKEGADSGQSSRGTECRFRLCWPVTINPMVVEHVALVEPAAAAPLLELRLAIPEKVEFSELDLSSLRLYLDPAETMESVLTLYWLLAENVSRVEVEKPGEHHVRDVTDQIEIVPVGFRPEDAVIPYPTASFSGYRLIQEYLGFQNKFLFVDIHGLDSVAADIEGVRSLTLKIHFGKLRPRLEQYPSIGRGIIKLHCAPVINLFDHPAEPIRNRHDRLEHLLQPSSQGLADRRDVEVFEVAAVSIVENGRTQKAHRFFDFTAPHYSEDVGVTYQTHLRMNVTGGDIRGGTDTYISFVDARTASNSTSQTISIDLVCTNRDLPRKNILVGEICVATDTSPEYAFRNISKATDPVPPPLGRDLHWALIAHQALNYSSLTDAESLRSMLRVYDFQSVHSAAQRAINNRRLEGILDLKSGYSERLVNGAIIRGAKIDVVLEEGRFGGEGGAYLFARILDQFFRLYVSLNSFSQLTVSFEQSGRVIAFPIRAGNLPTPALS